MDRTWTVLFVLNRVFRTLNCCCYLCCNAASTLSPISHSCLVNIFEFDLLLEIMLFEIDKMKISRKFLFLKKEVIRGIARNTLGWIIYLETNNNYTISL